MEPTRSSQATLNDLLDRILDNGILLNTDLIISVAGIPLLGVNLKLALAGMETMLEYGIMQDWDEAQRAVAMKESEIDRPSLGNDEYIIFSVFGTHWHSKGIYNSWRAGTLYITNKRLIQFRKMPSEVLFQMYYEEIRAMALRERDHFTGTKRKELHLLLKEDEVAQLHTNDSAALKKVLEDVIKARGLSLDKNLAFWDKKEVPGNFLQQGEEVYHSGQMWHQVSFLADGSTQYQWKPGHLYLTNKRLCWLYDFEKKLLLEIPSEKLQHVTVQNVQFGSAPVEEKSLIVLYKEGTENKVVCFSFDEVSLREWEKVIGELTKEQEVGRKMETCPRCGRKATREDLLDNGCSRCGWMSHRIQ